MRAGRAVPDRLPDDDRDETVLAEIDGACPYAAAGGDARDQHRVDTERRQRGGEGGAEERTGVLLDDVGLARDRLKPARELRQFRASTGLEAGERRDFPEEDATITAARLVGDRGVDDRDARHAC